MTLVASYGSCLVNEQGLWNIEITLNSGTSKNLLEVLEGMHGAWGVLLEKLGGGVRPASQNPYPIYDQNLRYSLP